MDVFWTVVAGVTVFVGGQVILRIVIEPILAIRRAKGRVAFGLRFHANRHGNLDVLGPEVWAETSNFWRELASEFDQLHCELPLYGLWSHMRFVPRRRALLMACTGMIGLSNSARGEHRAIQDRYNVITEQLKLPRYDV